MARSSATNTVTYKAEISDLRKKLADIPDITAAEARKAVNELTKSIKKQERLQEQAVKAAKSNARDLGRTATETADALKETGDTAGDVDSAAKAIAGAVGLINPELEEMLSGLGDASGGLEGVTKAFDLAGISAEDLAAAGPAVAVGIAAIGTAALVVANQTDEARRRLREYQEVIDDTEASTRALTSAQSALKLATGDVDGFIGDLQIKTAEMRGELEKSDLVAGQLGGKLTDNLRPALMAAGTAFAENEVRIGKLRDAIDAGTLSVSERVAAEEELGKALRARPDLEAKLAAVKAQQDRGRDAINQYAAALDTEAAKTDEAADATKRHTEAVKANEQAERDRLTAIEAVESIRQSAIMSGLDGESRILAVRDAQLSQLDELAQVLGDTLQVDLARTEVIGQAERELHEMRKQQAEEREKLRLEEQSKIEADFAAQQKYIADLARAAQGNQRAVTDSTLNMLGSVSDGLALASEQAAKSNADAGAALFRFSQGTAVATAIINTAVAATRALAELGPIAGPPAAAAVGVAGAVQVATIIAQQPPTFNDTPGVMVASSQGLQASFAPGDYFAAAQTPEALVSQAQRAAGGSDDRPIRVQFMLGHRVLQEQTVRAMDSSQGRAAVGTSRNYRRNPYVER